VRLDTGFPSSDAQFDFQRVVRRRRLSRLTRVLRREPSDVDVILPFEEVVDALGYAGERSRGLQAIDLDSIVGTVDRGKDFDRRFRPTSARVRSRWERIANAQRRGASMPPITVYRVGELHFVRDGHHRVSVARALGRDRIDAFVTEVRTKVEADRSIRFADLVLKSHERLFRERVPLPERAAERVKVTDAHDYARLAEGVEAWGFRAMQLHGRFMDRCEVAMLWFEEEYVPVITMLRETDLLGRHTETDAYLRIAAQRYELLRTHEWTPAVLERVRHEL
jgi:hypothetical protein